MTASNSAAPALIPVAQPHTQARDQVALLARKRFERSLAQARHYDFLPDSDVVDAVFCEHFAAKLIEAHVINQHRVDGKHFERYFVDCLKLAGHEAALADSLTNAGHDAIVDGARFQLKTEGSKRIRPDFIQISKLMESAGTKGLKSRQDALRFIPRVAEHLDKYERLLVLRIFDDEPGRTPRGVRYDLVEIPKSLFAGLRRLKARDFSAPLESGHTSVPLFAPDDPARATPALTVVLDGSDNKITLRNVRLDLCRVHAAFWVPWGEDILSGAAS